VGTRITVYLSHDLSRPGDPAETLKRLESAASATLALRDYSWGETPVDRRPHNKWELQPVGGRLPDLRLYYLPDLQLMVFPKAAMIGTTHRWTFFLKDFEVRHVHLSAFRAIAASLHSPQLAICASTHDDVTFPFMDGSYSQADCIEALQRILGPPLASVESIPPAITALGPIESREVWFLDRAPNAG
jgi:hypothetical protein